MPNREGCLYIMLSWIPVIAGILLVMSLNSGCYNRYTVRGDSPSGIPSVVHEEFAGGLVTTTDIDVSPSQAAYDRCRADRADQRLSGGSWIWSDDQMTCFWQASSGTRGGYGGGYGVSGGVVYATPRVGAPGVR
jgi:hypothetical protein